MIRGLSDRYRCIAPDLPGFGLSSSPPGHGFTAAEHAGSIGRFVEELDLRDVTLLVQDWGGPIGFAVAGAAARPLRRVRDRQHVGVVDEGQPRRARLLAGSSAARSADT